jgi:hypothetical protein
MAKTRGRKQRRHVREKATIDHLVRQVYEPKPLDAKRAARSASTPTGLPVEDQVRKRWVLTTAAFPTFLSAKRRSSQHRNHRDMHGPKELSRLRKRPLEADAATSGGVADEIDIASCATIAFSSEDPGHPVEHMFDGRSGPGATRWISARPDALEHIVVEFDQPQSISRLVYEVEEATRERTQEVRMEVSGDSGRTYRQIFVQEYTFSPTGATFQREEQRFNRVRASHLRLTIVPNKSGSGTATLTALRLFA